MEQLREGQTNMKNNKKFLTAMLATLCLGCVAVGANALSTDNASAAMTENSEVFRIVEGASVKVKEDEHKSGIRFTFLVEKNYFDSTVKNSDSVTVNTAVVPTKEIDGEATAANLLATASAEKETISADKWTTYKWDLDGDKIAESTVDENGKTWLTSYAYLYDLPATAYNWEISAVGYIETNGEVGYVTSVETRTMSYVASAALYDETEDWTTDEQNVLCAYLEGYNYGLTLGANSAQLMATTTDVVNEVTTQTQISTTTNAKVPVTYASSNDEVATVDANGNVTAVGGGTATITVSTDRLFPENTTSANETATFEVTVYDYYEIDTADEFLAMQTGDEYVYYALTDNVDFSNKLLVASDSRTTKTETYASPIGTATSKFSGTLDGKGYALNNVTVAGALSDTGCNAIGASVFAYMDGTVKNLAVDMMMAKTIASNGSTYNVASTKESGFIEYLYGGGVVENCYVKFSSHLTQYTNGNGKPIAAIASHVNAADDEATVKNCVGVMDLSGGVTHPASPFGGAATIIGGLNGANTTANIENCYGVMLTADGDTVHTAKIDSNDTATNAGTINKNTSSAYTSLADLYTAATTGMTTANGWNSLWTVDTTTESLKFGAKFIYPATQLNVTSSELFLLNNNENKNNVATSLQLIMRGTDATVAWSSSATGVATVADGLVTPVSAGTTTITATADGVNYTCDITVYNYYEIDTYYEFLTMKTNDSMVYYALTQDVDFSGYTVQVGATTTTESTTVAPVGTSSSHFNGIFDGKGYALKNVTVAGNENAINASLFLAVGSTGVIKNVSADLKILSTQSSVKNAGFVASLLGGTIENCYVKFTSHLAQYKSGNGVPVAAIVGGIDSGATVKNCIGVLDISAGVTHPATAFDGVATIAGGTTSASSTVTIENCYGILLRADNDTVHTATIDGLATVNAANVGTINTVNSTAHYTYADMYAAISAEGVMETYGWNDMWKIENNALYFGNMTTAIYTDTSAN